VSILWGDPEKIGAIHNWKNNYTQMTDRPIEKERIPKKNL